MTRPTDGDGASHTERAHNLFALHFISESPLEAARLGGGAASRGGDRWQRNERPLYELDDDIFTFAADHRMVVRHNNGGWPSRTLEWTDGIRRMIHIYLEDEAALTYTLSLCATQDRKQERFFKALALREGLPVKSIHRELDQLLDRGYRLLQSWTTADLEFSINLARNDSRPWTCKARITKPWQTGESNP